jgi:hypothetical protein
LPDKREHRGPHPSDAKLFAPEMIPQLRSAAEDFSLLLTKGYADKSALKLVGDKFSLMQRQRLAVMRSSCSDQQLESRNQRRVDIDSLTDKSIAIDGYNLLITIEAAMSGGVLFKGRDGCLRDLASIHGTYRKVTETIPAIELIGNFLEEQKIQNVLWLFDSPVSNSGRLKTLIRKLSEQNSWPWNIELSINPDYELKRIEDIVVSSDSIILDGCQRWASLASEIITWKIPGATVIDLS